MNLFDKESPIYIRVAYGHHNNRICDNLSDKENISCLYLFKLESRCMAGLRVTTSVSMRHQVTGGGALSSLAQAIHSFFLHYLLKQCLAKIIRSVEREVGKNTNKKSQST